VATASIAVLDAARVIAYRPGHLAARGVEDELPCAFRVFDDHVTPHAQRFDKVVPHVQRSFDNDHVIYSFAKQHV
jgi:hypothetical protein